MPGPDMDLLVGSFVLRPYVFAFLALFVGAAVRDLGATRTLLFGAIVWPLAWLCEFASTRVGVPFGLYAYTGLTRGRELYLADVPLFDSLSFTFLAYASYCLARRILSAWREGSTGRVGRAVLTGFLMMLLDVVIDPVAVRGERWFLGPLFAYAEPGVYFGVPLSNFAGWWLLGAAGIAGYEGCRSVRTSPPGGRPGPGIALYYAVLGFNLAVTAWIGEWGLLAVGSVLHAAVATALVAIGRRAPARAILETRRVQQA